MVLPRLLTALALGPLAVWVCWVGGLSFALFVSLLIVLSLHEFGRMARLGGYATQGWAGWAGGALALTALVFSGPRSPAAGAEWAGGWALTAALVLWTGRELARRDKGLSMLRMAMSFAGLCLVVWPLSALILLRDVHHATVYEAGRWSVFFLLAVVWSQDTVAYAVGRLFGRRRLAPLVSPKKSWEGAVGGLVAAVAAGWLAREWGPDHFFGRGEAVAVAAAVGVLAQMSDLLESMMKRCFGVKDSSSLLPGHGGVLDRLDSFILTAPCLYLYVAGRGP